MQTKQHTDSGLNFLVIIKTVLTAAKHLDNLHNDRLNKNPKQPTTPDVVDITEYQVETVK